MGMIESLEKSSLGRKVGLTYTQDLLSTAHRSHISPRGVDAVRTLDNVFIMRQSHADYRKAQELVSEIVI